MYELLADEPRPPTSAPGTDVEAIQPAEAIVRLKDVAELAVGPSYSAVLFDDDELEADVNELEAKSDELRADGEAWSTEGSERIHGVGRLRGFLPRDGVGGGP